MILWKAVYSNLTSVVDGARYSVSMIFWKAVYSNLDTDRQIPLKKSDHRWVQYRVYSEISKHTRPKSEVVWWRWAQSAEPEYGDTPYWNSKTLIIGMLKRDDGQKGRREERWLHMLVFK